MDLRTKYPLFPWVDFQQLAMSTFSKPGTQWYSEIRRETMAFMGWKAPRKTGGFQKNPQY